MGTFTGHLGEYLTNRKAFKLRLFLRISLVKLSAIMKYWLGALFALSVALSIVAADYERILSAEEDALNENLLKHLAKRSSSSQERYQMMMKKKMEERKKVQAQKEAEEAAAEQRRKQEEENARIAAEHKRRAEQDAAKRAARAQAKKHQG